MNSADVKIFDCHGHFGPCRSFHMADDGSIESMMSVMDAAGIRQIVVSSMLALYYDISAGNKQMLQAVTTYPNRFLGYIAMSPRLGETNQIDELESCRGTPGVAGVKIHPGLHNSRPGDTGYEPVYRWCVEYGYPLLSHTWGERDIIDFEKVLQRHPKLSLILGHSGGPYRAALERACELSRKHDGVYLDITCSQTLAGLIEWMAARTATDKILFGSDTPFIDPRPSVGLVTYARIDDAAKESILFGNAERLFAERINHAS